MVMTDNKKYIAEAWIDNGKDEEFKKSYLKALIEEYQGHGNGFDADMVDGMHYNDIKNYIDNLDKQALKKFSIGNTVFSPDRQSTHYILGFEAIKLYNKDFDGSDSDYRELPWREVSEEEIPTLYDVIAELYNITYFGGEEDEGKTNKEIYEAFKSTVEEINSRLLSLETTLEGKIIDGKLDSDSVNGIRFFIYTPEQYAALEEDALTNPESEKKLKSIHNVFIIKSRQEIIDGGYEEGIYPYNPDVAVIDKHYKFRVINQNAYDEETNEYVDGAWLQYTHQDCDTWFNLCPARNFISIDDIYGTVAELLETKTDYKINKDSLEASLQDVEVSDDLNIPFVNYIRNNYLRGGIYSYNPETNDKIFLDTIEINNLKYLDTTKLQKAIKDETQAILDEYKLEIQQILNGFEQTITNLSSRVGTLEGKVNTYESRFLSVESRLSALETVLNNVRTWNWVPLTGEKKERREECFVWYNSTLKIAYVYYSINFCWDGENDWKPRQFYVNKNYSDYADYVPTNCLPKEYIMFTTADPNVTCAIDPSTGQLRLRVTGGKTQTKRFTYGSVFYRLK